MSEEMTKNPATARIASLESRYEGLRDEIHGLRRDFSEFAQEIRRENSIRGRTNWSPIIAGIAVVVSVIGGLITLGAQGPLQNIQRNEMAVVNLSNALREHSKDFISHVNDAEKEAKEFAISGDVEVRQDLKELAVRLDQLLRDFHEHEKSVGHTATEAKLDAMDRLSAMMSDRVRSLEGRTDGSAVMASKIEAIQREIELLRADVSAMRKP